MDNTTEEEGVAVEVAAPHESESARYLRVRREAKAEAAVTIKENAKKAEAAKKRALSKAPTIEGLKEFNEAAAEIERRINETSKEAV